MAQLKFLWQLLAISLIKSSNNVVTPPETPEFNPEKYILNEEKFDITGNKLLDDDKELTDKVADTNKDPYVGQS